jgi:hypothetical protein
MQALVMEAIPHTCRACKEGSLVLLSGLGGEGAHTAQCCRPPTLHSPDWQGRPITIPTIGIGGAIEEFVIKDRASNSGYLTLGFTVGHILQGPNPGFHCIIHFRNGYGANSGFE